MDEHKWAMLPGSADGCQCIRCGMVASNSAIAAGAGAPTPHGWLMSEFATALPPCGELDIDAEVARLLAGEFDER